MSSAPPVVRPVKIATVEAHRCDRLGRLATRDGRIHCGHRARHPAVPAAS
jgi:hypothetical protein